LFGKEDRESLVSGHDGLVRLDLREVWIRREVQRDVRRDAELYADAGVGLDRLIDEATVINEPGMRVEKGQREDPYPAPFFRKRQRRNDLKRAFGRDAF